jgi:hypothetical protein
MRTIAILFLTLWSGTAMAFENQKLLGAKPTQELQEAEDRAPCGSAARPASIDESLIRCSAGRNRAWRHDRPSPSTLPQ